MNASTLAPILALDAAIGPASACLITDEQTFYAESDGSQPHSQIILPLLERLMNESGLQWSDIQTFALSTGPGSFTGIRVIAATIAGINAALKRPVMSLSSLAVTAAQADSKKPLWVLEDARANEVFVGHYQEALALQADACIAWSDVHDLEASGFVSHAEPTIDLAAWQRYPLTIPRSKALEAVALKQSQDLNIATLPTLALPVYLQISQAERSAAGG